jgi:hypothetical protein
MLELEHNGYYPLTKEHLDCYVPSRPGIFMLAVRLVNGVHRTFFTSQSDNLYRSLRTVAQRDWSHLPPVIQEYLEEYQCYFTYFVIFKTENRDEVEKMLTQTMDPVIKLKMVNCN